MSLYDWVTKMGPQERRRIPHFLCSNNQGTLHLGDVLKWRVRGQAHE